VPTLLVVSDEDEMVDAIDAAVGGPGVTLRHVRNGIDVRAELEGNLPDLVILDLQIGRMGGMATCMDLRLEESAGRIGHVAVLMVLDRRADVFLARRCGADGWILKPLDPIRVQKAVTTLLDGQDWHDETAMPSPVAVAIGGPDEPVTDVG
jgi:DNA-binding response OmpR family regulator